MLNLPLFICLYLSASTLIICALYSWVVLCCCSLDSKYKWSKAEIPPFIIWSWCYSLYQHLYKSSIVSSRFCETCIEVVWTFLLPLSLSLFQIGAEGIFWSKTSRWWYSGTTIYRCACSLALLIQCSSSTEFISYNCFTVSLTTILKIKVYYHF